MNDERSISEKPSMVWLPESTNHETILQFLVHKFPAIRATDWVSRIDRGKVHFEDGPIISISTPYKPSTRVCYYRELPTEKKVPFEERILYEDDNILVADKPHFLTIHPVGNYINQTLVSRLKKKTGLSELNHAHRIDRLTAGLVLFTKKQELRKHYQTLFENSKVQKTYEALGPIPKSGETNWHLKNQLIKGNTWFLMAVGTGEPNSESYIKLIDEVDGFGLFELKPITGKKHQLRVHMCCIGSYILNDPRYPDLQDESEDDYTKPLKLLAKTLEFKDPITGKEMKFESKLSLV